MGSASSAVGGIKALMLQGLDYVHLNKSIHADLGLTLKVVIHGDKPFCSKCIHHRPLHVHYNFIMTVSIHLLCHLLSISHICMEFLSKAFINRPIY